MSLNHDGTALRCKCCKTKTVAVSYPDDGKIEIRKRAHGQDHVAGFSLRELVEMLDPAGTSYQPVKVGKGMWV